MDLPSELWPFVLLVHPQPSFREELARTLTQCGFDICIVSNRGDALRAASAESPEFAVVDLALPEGDGIELVLELRLIDPTTRIIALSSLEQPAVAAAASALGRTTCLRTISDASEITKALALMQDSDSSG